MGQCQRSSLPSGSREQWKASLLTPASLKLSQALRRGLAQQKYFRPTKRCQRARLEASQVSHDLIIQGSSQPAPILSWQGPTCAFWQQAAALCASVLVAAGPSQALVSPTADVRQSESGSNAVLEQSTASSRNSIEESLAGLARTVEARLDSAIGLISDFGLPSSWQEDPGVTAQGKELIKEVWEVIARKYVDVRSGGFDQQRWAQLRDDALAKPLRDKDSVERAIRSMLADGISDRFTRFITAEQFARMQSYDITGVGLNLCTGSELEEKTDFRASQPGLYVLGLINQSPASRAGIAQGDQLLEVDGVSITNESPFQAATLIQGPEDGPRTPKVSVKVRHGESGDIRVVSLDRPVVDTASPVQSRLVNVAGRKMGQIRVEKFVARTQPDVAAAVVRLREQGAQEFVLDLRDNLGGLVEEGVEVARLFLDGNVTIVNRLDSGGIRPRMTSNGRALTQAPLTLLVNERTASASEILAGALRDNCRAVLVGQRTYGKGLIQSVYQLEDGSALAVTIGKYLTPARTDIDREGIRPDFGSIPDRNVAANTLASCKIPQAV